MITRRSLLSGASAVALVGCSQNQTTVPPWVAGLQAILALAESIIPQLQAAGLSDALLAQAQQIVSGIQTALAGITDASTQAQGQTALQQIETYINALAPIVAKYAGLVPGGSIIGLIVGALPAIEAGLNFVLNLLTPAAQALAKSAPPLPSAGKNIGVEKDDAQGYLNLLIETAKAKKKG